jgi:hypothetical protein
MTDRCNVLLMGVGLLNKWKFPDIPGLDRFQGTKIHSAAWNASVDVKGKNVAVVGAGSTGIQIVPTIQPLVKHMHHYMKGRNWISPVGIGGDELLRRNAASGNCKLCHSSTSIFFSGFGDTDTILKSNTARRNWLSLPAIQAHTSASGTRSKATSCKHH